MLATLRKLPSPTLLRCPDPDPRAPFLPPSPSPRPCSDHSEGGGGETLIRVGSSRRAGLPQPGSSWSQVTEPHQHYAHGGCLWWQSGSPLPGPLLLLCPRGKSRVLWGNVNASRRGGGANEGTHRRGAAKGQGVTMTTGIY